VRNFLRGTIERNTARDGEPERMEPALVGFSRASARARDEGTRLFCATAARLGAAARERRQRKQGTIRIAGYRMIQRRAEAARIETRIGNHTFRATGITAYRKNNGMLEAAQHIANHESPRTTNLYDRRQDEIWLDEVEKIGI
jgi:hypothetical protein